MHRIQTLGLQAINFTQALHQKKAASIKGIAPRIAISKPLPRIFAMMAKKNSGSALAQADKSVPKTEVSRPGSATITAPYGNSTKTRILIKFDVGFGNTLFIRGQGANLSWDKGIPMKNLKADEWAWETENAFSTAEFKILINDNAYEAGRNHLLHCGTTVQYTPRF